MAPLENLPDAASNQITNSQKETFEFYYKYANFHQSYPKNYKQMQR